MQLSYRKWIGCQTFINIYFTISENKYVKSINALVIPNTKEKAFIYTPIIAYHLISTLIYTLLNYLRNEDQQVSNTNNDYVIEIYLFIHKASNQNLIQEAARRSNYVRVASETANRRTGSRNITRRLPSELLRAVARILVVSVRCDSFLARC